MKTVDDSDVAFAEITGGRDDAAFWILVTMHQRGIAGQVMGADWGPKMSPAIWQKRATIAAACGTDAAEVKLWEEGKSSPASVQQAAAWISAMYDENPESMPFRPPGGGLRW